MKVQEIVTRVWSAIDELMPNDSQFLSQSADEKNLDNVIIDKIGFALQDIMANAPLEKLGNDMITTLSASSTSTDFSIGTDLVGTLKLPTDIIRIVEARLSSWSHFPKPESDTSQIYLMQQDKYARGSYDRPVNILTINQEGKRILEMYCAKATTDKLHFAYIGKPSLTNVDASHLTTDVKCPTELEGALIYQIAGLTMLAFKEESAAKFFQVADRYMNLETKGSE